MTYSIVAIIGFALGVVTGFASLMAFLVWSHWDDQRSLKTHPNDPQYRRVKGTKIVIGDVELEPHPRPAFLGVEVPDEMPEEL